MMATTAFWIVFGITFIVVSGMLHLIAGIVSNGVRYFTTFWAAQFIVSFILTVIFLIIVAI